MSDAGTAQTHQSCGVSARQQVVLDTYEGWPESLDAPDWTRWTAGRTVTFVSSRKAIAEIIRKTQDTGSMGVSVSPKSRPALGLSSR